MGGFRTALLFDMRAPAFGAGITELYRAALDMSAFGDAIGVDYVGLMEHHGAEDGYLPSPFVMGGGVAARTHNCRISLGAVLLPLHDPVKIAEHIAVLDQMSGGRLEVIFGAGYVPSEFARFRVSMRDRGKLLDQGIDIIQRALRGERFEADGREIFVRPLPVQQPEELLMAGGSVEASARRAARFDIGFAPMVPHLLPLYEAECRKLGRRPRDYHAPAIPVAIHLATDIDRGWLAVKAHALHVATTYAKWAEEEQNSNSPFKGLLEEEALRASGMFAVWTPEQLLATAREAENVTLGFMPLLGGLDPAIGWNSLKLLETVMPQLRQLQAARR